MFEQERRTFPDMMRWEAIGSVCGMVAWLLKCRRGRLANLCCWVLNGLICQNPVPLSTPSSKQKLLETLILYSPTVSQGVLHDSVPTSFFGFPRIIPCPYNRKEACASSAGHSGFSFSRPPAQEAQTCKKYFKSCKLRGGLRCRHRGCTNRHTRGAVTSCWNTLRVRANNCRSSTFSHGPQPGGSDFPRSRLAEACGKPALSRQTEGCFSFRWE